jgi:phage tail-like protein
MAALVAASTLPLSASATGLAPTDPIAAARFSVVVDGVEIASFSELAGITSEIQPVDTVSNAGSGVVLKKLPGKRTPPTLTLKRGKNQSTALWAWHQAVLDGTSAARHSASLVMYRTDGTPVARYHLENAWPSKLEVGAPDASKNEVSIETLELTAEAITRV